MDPERQQAFIPQIESRLTEIASEIMSTSDEAAAISPDVSIGRLSRLDSMQHQQIALAGKRRLEDERNRLLEARRRIDAGTFGKCLLCGQDIDEQRLSIRPDAVVCVPCSQKR